MMRALLYLVAILVVVGVATSMYLFSPQGAAIATFEECVAAGNPVMESYPRQCRSADGLIFVEDISGSNATTTDGMTWNGCAVAGCSSQLCVSAEEAEQLVTDCEFKPEYACYREASCGPQADGACGWTMTPELAQCLANPPALAE